MATEMNFEADFLASLIPDMPSATPAATEPGNTNDFLNNLFGTPAAAPAPAAEPAPVEAVATPAPAPAPAEELKAEEPKAVEEAPAPVEEAKVEAEPVAAPAPAEVKAEVPETKAEEAPVAEPAPVVTAPPVAEVKTEEPKAEVKAEPAKVEAPAAEEKAEEVAVEVTKPKRRRSTKKAAAKKETQKLDVPEAGQLDENFIPTLLLSVGSRYEQYKQEIQTLMNEIELTPDMNKATVQTMIAKQTKLAKMIEFYGEGYHDALENLAGKDGMIDRIVLRTAQETEGTATEKKDAGRVACMNYVDPKTGEHQDLMQWKKGLESAVGFFSRAADYCKTVGVALSTYSKLY